MDFKETENNKFPGIDTEMLNKNYISPNQIDLDTPGKFIIETIKKNDYNTISKKFIAVTTRSAAFT